MSGILISQLRRSRAAAVWAGSVAILCTCLGAAAGPAAAQDGRIVGQVVSARTGEPLPGVQVSVEGTQRGALTDARGRYLLVGVPEGSHGITARSLGYARKTVTGVTVAPGGAATVDISLEPEAVALEGVTVSATRERGSTAALLGDRQRSGVVVDAVGREQIARSADGDAASALKRVPGVSVVDGKFVYVRGLGERYGAATLNGAPLPSPLPDKKAVPLDLIPSALLESVVTAKTYSPDQPGDYAGGLVQLRTRDFPTSRVLRLSTSVSYESNTSLATGLGYSGGSLDWVGFDDGTRSLPASVRPGEPVRMPAEGGAREDFVRSLTGAWTPGEQEVPLNRSFSATFGDQFELAGRRFGFLAAGTYSNTYRTTGDLVERYYAQGDGPSLQVDYDGLSTNHMVSLGGLLNASYQLRETDRLGVKIVYNRLVDDESRQLGGLFESQGPYIRAPRLRYVANELRSAQVEGDHVVFGRSTAAWRFGHSRAGRYEPNTRTVVYRAGEEDGPYEFFPGPSSGLVFHQSLVDDGMSAALDLRHPGGTERSVTLGLGAAADLRTRDVYTRRYRLVPRDLNQEELRLAPAELFTPERLGSQLDVVESTFREDNYDAALDVLAAYLLLDASPLPRLRLVGGARLEQATQSVTPAEGLDPSAAGDATTELRNLDLLPSLNLTYEIRDGMNLRAGASGTVARPQFREMTPFLFADYYGGMVSRGNPHVERTRITNLDLRWEWFPAPGAVLSVGGFQKVFSNPIEPFAFLLGSNPAQTWVNTGGARLRGIETELRTSLGFLGGLGERLALNANLTVAASRVRGDSVVIHDPDTGGRLPVRTSESSDRPLFGQSPYVANLGLTYAASSGTSATVLFNRFGRRLDAFGGQGLPDIYERARNQLDLVLERRVGDGLALKVAGSRLLGNRVEYTQTFANEETVITRSYDAGRTLSISVSWEPDSR